MSYQLWDALPGDSVCWKSIHFSGSITNAVFIIRSPWRLSRPKSTYLEVLFPTLNPYSICFYFSSLNHTQPWIIGICLISHPVPQITNKKQELTHIPPYHPHPPNTQHKILIKCWSGWTERQSRVAWTSVSLEIQTLYYLMQTKWEDWTPYAEDHNGNLFLV